MKLQKILLTLFAAFLTVGMTLGCERKDVEEATDQDDVGVLDRENPDELEAIDPQPEEAGDELPGVEPGQVPDADLTE